MSTKTHTNSFADVHSSEGVTLEELPKAHVFTSSLPPDPDFPTPEASANAPRSFLGPRRVMGALYTFVAPTPTKKPPELLAISRPAFRTLGISLSEANNPIFKNLVAGNPTGIEEEVYPWAQCYGGWQFGQWAGQLGDGRAISLFEATNPFTGERNELQLKGAGITPYSRFADGKAVLRSSIREFIASEYLHSIGVPTTRALSITLTGDTAMRERVEPCAIVARFAPSWIRFGTFDLLRFRNDRKNLRILADYVIKEVLKLPQPPPGTNRFLAMYHEIAKLNALTVAQWQCHGFMNGVLNTDNTSIMGLSIDFGPFAFMDAYDPNFTPNHDDHGLRYAYVNQPLVILWNIIQLGDDLAGLFAVTNPDDPEYLERGVQKENMEEHLQKVTEILKDVVKQYKETFSKEYNRLMADKMGLADYQETDNEILFTPCLEMVREFELDYHHFFRRLAETSVERVFISDGDENEKIAVAKTFIPASKLPASVNGERAIKEMVKFLDVYVQRLAKDGNGEKYQEMRMRRMKNVNPKFVPKNWVLEDVIERVEKKGDRKVMDKIMKMVERPFDDNWDGLGEDAERWCGDVPMMKRGTQCSCSS